LSISPPPGRMFPALIVTGRFAGSASEDDLSGFDEDELALSLGTPETLLFAGMSLVLFEDETLKRLSGDEFVGISLFAVLP